jgi:hypothetical protein
MNEEEFREAMAAKLKELSQLWSEYGGLMLKSDHRDREEEAKHAFGIAADYLYRAITEHELALSRC